MSSCSLSLSSPPCFFFTLKPRLTSTPLFSTVFSTTAMSSESEPTLDFPRTESSSQARERSTSPPRRASRFPPSSRSDPPSSQEPSTLTDPSTFRLLNSFTRTRSPRSQVWSSKLSRRGRGSRTSQIDSRLSSFPSLPSPPSSPSSSGFSSADSGREGQPRRRSSTPLPTRSAFSSSRALARSVSL